MINVLIFSKDRAFQLDALLASMQCTNPLFNRVTVLYTGSNNAYLQGYDIIKNKINKGTYHQSNLYNTKIDLVQEVDFDKDLKTILSIQTEGYICMMCDDTVFFMKKKIIGILPKVLTAMEDKDMACFSLRNGLNLSCSLYNYSLKDDVITYNWREQGDWRNYFAFPLSTDSHIFKIELLRAIVNQNKQINPNQLEGNIRIFESQLPKKMACFTQSISVTNSVNLVSTTSKCAFGEKYNYSQQYLNEKFLDGYVMDLDKLDTNNITDCHTEMEINFKKY